jgi:Ca-activated chloride channel homolog
MRRLLYAGAGVVGALTLTSAMLSAPSEAAAASTTEPNPGQLTIVQQDGRPGQLCPLERTSVSAQISGFGARVTVVQNFVNPTKEPIEAVYTFPLPHDAAVDRMRMQVGSRIIEGQIKRREEARRIYDVAKQAGQTASLLDQERPNIFTQSVANIMPGERVRVEISYVQVLKYENGEFEFNFPMVVGPRYVQTAEDPDKVAPPITPKGTRTGSNIDLTVDIDAGARIVSMGSELHQVNTRKNGNSGARVTLAKKDEIPNRDFILRYKTATDSIQSAFVTHMDPGKRGFFTLILMPPKAPTQQQIAPREIIFVMDQSGSQRGFPIEKSKELTLKLIRTMRPGDTFNVIGFSTMPNLLWPSSRPNNVQNLAEAVAFINGMQANGGTEFRGALIEALKAQDDPGRVRLVVFNTDGLIGNEAQVLDLIKQRRDNARVFTFGIGNSVNRYVIEAMSVEGKGDYEIVTLSGDSDKAVERFFKRTQTPILTDVQVDFEGVQVEQVLPTAIPDVFDEKPIVVYGRYDQAGPAKVTVRGNLGGQPWSQTLDVHFGAREAAPALPTLWARRQVDHLTRSNYLATLRDRQTLESTAIVDLALEFGIMTQHTSFVAVEQRVVNIGGKQRTVRVPVEMADGVSYGGVGLDGLYRGSPGAPAAMSARSGSIGGGMGGGGSVGGTGGGVGGAGGAGAVMQSRGRMEAIAADPTDNSIVAMREKQMTPEERKKSRFTRKVAKELREAKGRLEVMIWLEKLGDEELKELRKHGIEIALTDKALKVVFGFVDAKDLAELADLEFVQRIEKLDEEERQ